MTSPQQSATTSMGELTWAQVMPAEAYWRERISNEIMLIDLEEAKEISSDWYAAAMRTRFICSMIAKQGMKEKDE